MMLDFDAIIAHSLPYVQQILEELIPTHKIVGDEFVMLNPRRHDTSLGSFKYNLKTNLWAEYASVEGGRCLPSIYAYVKGYTYYEAMKELAYRFNMTEESITRKECVNKEYLSNKIKTDIFYYYTPQGLLLARVVRTNLPNGKKDFRQQTLDAENIEWKMSGPKQPVLYNAREIFAYPDATLVWCEGEKCADAINMLAISNIIGFTSISGAAAVLKADWDLVRGRKLILWPDADEPGQKALEVLKEKFPNALVVTHDKDAAKAVLAGDDIRMLLSCGKIPWPDIKCHFSSKLTPSFDYLPAEFIEWASKASHNACIEIDAMITAAIATSCACIHGDVCINMPFKQTPTFWAIIVAPSGSRKSALWNYTHEFIKEKEKEMFEENFKSRAKYEQEIEIYKSLISNMKKAATPALKTDGTNLDFSSDVFIQKPKEPPQNQIVLGTSATFEAAHKSCCDNPRGIFAFYDEFSSFIGNMMNNGKQNFAIEAFFLGCADSANGVTINRIGRGIVSADRTRMSFLAGCQPDIAKKYIKPSTEMGMIPRFAWVQIQPKVAPEEYEILDCKKYLYDMHKKLWNLKPRELHFSQDAMKVFKKYASQQGKRALKYKEGHWRSWLNKSSGTLMRLCAIFHCMFDEYSGEITLDTLEMANRFLEEFLLPHTKNFLSTCTEIEADANFFSLEEQEQKILAWICSKNKTKKSKIRNSCYQAMDARMNKQKFETFIEQIIHQGYVRDTGANIECNPHLEELLKEYYK